LPAFLSKLSDTKQETRTDAISGIGCLRQEDLLMHLLPLIQNGADGDRIAVSAQIWGLSFETFQHLNQLPMEWSQSGRVFWRDKMVTALQDSNVQVRKHAARALMALGDRNSVLALKIASDLERDRDTRFYMEETIKALEKSSS
jgi:HEAT repeat protein